MNFDLINLVSFLPPTSAKVLHSFFGLRHLVRETHYKKIRSLDGIGIF